MDYAEVRPLMARTSLISRLAGIDVLLAEFAAQNREYAQFRTTVLEELRGIKEQEKIRNGRLGKVEGVLGISQDREEQRQVVATRRRGWREQLGLISMGAVLSGTVALIVHVLGAG